MISKLLMAENCWRRIFHGFLTVVLWVGGGRRCRKCREWHSGNWSIVFTKWQPINLIFTFSSLQGHRRVPLIMHWTLLLSHWPTDRPLMVCGVQGAGRRSKKWNEWILDTSVLIPIIIYALLELIIIMIMIIILFNISFKQFMYSLF